MTIVYFISTVGHGKGGHFHSLNTIANALGKTQNVHIINIGVKPSEVLDTANFELTFIEFNGYNVVQAYLKAKRLVKKIQPDVLHAFDVESFAFSRLLSKKLKIPSFLNKCGGPNPKKYYPIPSQLVLFSRENKAYFENNTRYSKTKLSLIPNRVKAVNIDHARVEAFHKIHGKSDISLLRIARIGKHYHKSIVQSINLLEWLKAKGLPIRLVILGTIQSGEIYQSILDYVESKQLTEDIIIDTSDEFTHNASELLEVGNIVIGTGRNFMEASSLNKMLLVPYKDAEYPLLVDNANFDAIFATNFSPRTQVPNFNENKNLESIYNSLIKHQKAMSKQWFESFFDVNRGAELYKNLYLDTDMVHNSNGIDTFVNMLYAIKTFVLK